MQELSDMRAELMEHVTLVMNNAADYLASFDDYSYLWTDDRHEFMRQFLLYNHVLTAEEIEAHAEDGVPESPPSLKQFRDQVDCTADVLSLLLTICVLTDVYQIAGILPVLLGRVDLGAQRPIVVKLSRERSVGRFVQCIVEKRRIGSGSRLAS